MSTPSLTLLETFAATARLGSFAAAARQLGVSPSAVGKAIQRLEGDLGLTLFQRTTRHFELTEEARHLLTRLAPALEALDEALAETRDQTGRIAGSLVLSVPLVGYHLVCDRLASFFSQHPDVTVEIRFTDMMEDLITEGVDLGIRNGPLRDSSLKSRRFGGYRHALFAAPNYLTRHGIPEMATLDAHERIALRFGMTGRFQSWLRKDGTPLMLSPPRLVVSAIEGARSAAVAGMGVAWLPDFLIAEDLATERLVPVLEDDIGESGDFFLVWPVTRAISRRLRALIDHLAAPRGWS